MKTIKEMLLGGTFIIMTAALFSFNLPVGWYKAGSEPESYDMGVENGVAQDGKNAATIKSIEENIDGFGTLMQKCLSDKYQGKRVRMSGMVKTKDVTDWAGLWLRVDQKGAKKALSFDNMRDGKVDRSIRGTTGWTKYEIVLDVPPNATNLAFGALLYGSGQIWFDKIKFEVVGSNVPTTGRDKECEIAGIEPVNLDFEN